VGLACLRQVLVIFHSTRLRRCGRATPPPPPLAPLHRCRCLVCASDVLDSFFSLPSLAHARVSRSPGFPPRDNDRCTPGQEKQPQFSQHSRQNDNTMHALAYAAAQVSALLRAEPHREKRHTSQQKKKASSFSCRISVEICSDTHNPPFSLGFRPARPHPRATISHPTTHMLMQAQSSRTSAATASPPASAAVAPQVSAPSNPLPEKHVSPPSKIRLLL
jgi:hypothetical protein